MFKSVKKSILNPRPLRERVTRTCRVRGIDDKNTSAFKVILERERSELSRGSRNIMAISLNQMYHPGSSANELTLKAKDDESGCLLRCWKRWFSACCSVLKYPSPEAGASTSPARGEVLKSAVIFSVFMLFSAAAQAKVCFLPDSNCGGVNYGYTDKSGSTCTYKTREEANRKKGECETVQKQGFCFYLSCSMSKSDCDKAAANDPNHDKCCVPCGNCWKVDDCSIPPIPTCTGANYETEQTCKNKNQNFKPNGKFDKNGTACGECKDVPYITCPEMGDDYVTRAECTAKGSSFTFASADVKDSDGNECGTCSGKEENAKTCSEIRADYISKPECKAQNGSFHSANVKDLNGKLCGTCDKKTCSKQNSSWTTQGSCGSDEKEEVVGEGKDNTVCVKCTKTKTCHEMGYNISTDCKFGNLDTNNIIDVNGFACGVCEINKSVHIDFINRFVDCKINKSNITGTYQGLSFATVIYDGNIRQTYNNFSSRYINSCKHMTGTYGCSGIAPWYKNNDWYETYQDECLNRKIIIIGLVPGSKIKRVSVTPYYGSKACTSINQDTGEIEPYCRMYKCYSDDGYYGTVNSSSEDSNSFCYHGCDSLRHFSVSLAELKSTYFLDNYEDDLSVENEVLRSHVGGSFYQDEFDSKFADKGPFKLTKCWYPSVPDNIDNITFDAVEFTAPIINSDTGVSVVFEKDDEISCEAHSDFSPEPDLYIDRFGNRYNVMNGFPLNDLDSGFPYGGVFTQVDKCTSYPYYDTDYVVDFNKDCK